jgi:DNA repair exonuclease SbcCD ATPase subunit
MIKKLRISNFQSWEKLEFNINSGITSIDGYNIDDDCSEGSGKSAVINALCWLAYGEIPKDVKVDEVIRRGQKGCSGVLTLDHPVYQSINRSRNPNQVYLLTNSGEKITGKDARETQELINDILGMSFKTFCMSCYFSQNQHSKFISATPEEKSKILSEILNLLTFDKAYKKAHELLKIEKSSYDSLMTTRTSLEVEQKHIEELIDIADKRIVEREAQALKKIKEIETRILDLNLSITNTADKIDNLLSLELDDSDILANLAKLEKDKVVQEELRQALLVNIGSVDEKRQFKIRLQTSQQSQLKSLEKVARDYTKLEAFIANPTKVCPTCGTVLEKADTSHAIIELEGLGKKIEDLGTDLDALEEQIKAEPVFSLTQLQSELSKVDESLRDFRLSIKTEKDKLLKAQNIKNQIELLKRQVEKDAGNLSKEQDLLETAGCCLIDDLIEEKARYQVKLDTCIENRGTTDVLLAEKLSYMNRLETLKVGFKETKSYVFNSALGELTRKLNKYASALFEMPVKVKFNNDDMKITTSINLNGDECSLGTLSGGQGSRVSLACDLALAEMVSTRNKGLDLAIFDEPFQNFSESSMLKSIELFRGLKKPIIIIEHNSIVKSIVNKTFSVKLQKGVSTVS